MDELHFELAAKVEQAERDEGIFQARLRALIARSTPDDFDGLCTECQEPVAKGRVDLGYYVCIDCAEATELDARLSRLR